MAWGSTHKTKLCKIHLKQKHAFRLKCNENKFTHTKIRKFTPLMRSLQVLNVFQINIQKILVFITCSDVPMYQVFLQINWPILPMDIQQISRKTTSHYLNIYVTNQNIWYVFEVLHFWIRYHQTLRKNSKKCLYLKQNWNQKF